MRVLPSYLIGVNSMTYRQLKPRQVVPLELVETELTAEQVAAYLRQSSDFQVLNNTESADMQLTGALRYAVSRGLNADKIVIAHEGEGKRGVSGTLLNGANYRRGVDPQASGDAADG